MAHYATTIEIPTLDDVEKTLPIRTAEVYGNPNPNEIVALGGAVYEGVKPFAYDSHRRLCARMAVDIGESNFWILPSHERLPYPYSPLYSVAGMFKTEKQIGRKADWLLWIDDDVCVVSDLYRVLRKAADPKERRFVTVPACDRQPPFRVAIWQDVPTAGLTIRKHWVAKGGEDDPYKLLPGEMWMPTSGIHEIKVTGLCAALIHRSLFDEVKQPWFAVLPGDVDGEGNIEHRVNTDGWWSQQLQDAGIKSYACCDTIALHLGTPLPVSPMTAPILRQIFGRPAGTQDPV